MAGEPKYEVGSVQRAIDLLNVLASRPWLKLVDLSKAMNANNSTLLRTLRVLEAEGFVLRRHTGDYVLGSRLATLGHAAVASLDMVAALRPGAAALARELDVTAHIGLVSLSAVTVVEKIDPPHPLVRYSTLGTRMPLHATAAGKAALALMSDDEIADGRLPRPLEQFTSQTIVELPALLQEIAQVRKQRYSIENSEYHAGFCCAGSAVRVGDELYTLSISGAQVPASELRDRARRLLEAVDHVLGEHVGSALGI